MSKEHDGHRYDEVDARTAKAAYQSAFERLDLAPEELLLGKVDENGDILWSGYPRWLVKHPGTLPTADGIIEDMLGPVDPPPDPTCNDDNTKRSRSDGR